MTHRDLKPGNVLYGDDGHLRVADFGLADVLRRSADEADLTDDGSRVGSPEYWSPEQAAGLAVTERADMYALGCILYELATGTLPFEGSDRIEVGTRRMHEDPPLPTQFVPDLPPDAEALIMSLLTRAPERRPRAEDVARMLAGDVPILPEHDAAETTRIPAYEIPDTLIAPPDATPRPGVRGGGIRVGVVLLAIGVFLMGIGVAVGVGLTRSGIVPEQPLGRMAAAAGLSVLGGAAVICLALAVIALWATRNRDRANMRTARLALGTLAVITAALCSGTIVWTANAWVTVGVSALWRGVQ